MWYPMQCVCLMRWKGSYDPAIMHIRAALINIKQDFCLQNNEIYVAKYLWQGKKRTVDASTFIWGKNVHLEHNKYSFSVRRRRNTYTVCTQTWDLSCLWMHYLHTKWCMCDRFLQALPPLLLCYNYNSRWVFWCVHLSLRIFWFDVTAIMTD